MPSQVQHRDKARDVLGIYYVNLQMNLGKTDIKVSFAVVAIASSRALAVPIIRTSLISSYFALLPLALAVPVPQQDDLPNHTPVDVAGLDTEFMVNCGQ
jgi:hypothetical protein